MINENENIHRTDEDNIGQITDYNIYEVKFNINQSLTRFGSVI